MRRRRWGVVHAHLVGKPRPRPVRVGYLAVTLVAIMATVVLAACKPPGGAAASGSSGTGSTYTMGESILPSQMANMNPLLITGNWPNLFRYVYDGLFYFDPVTGKLDPDLAAAQGTWSSDHLKYTVKLNPNATWQDGKPVTAADVTYTYDTLKKYPQADQYGLWQHLSGVQGRGESVTFTVKNPLASLPDLLSEVYILPQHIWAKSANPLNDRNLHPIGSGAFQFQSYQNGVAIKLKSNPHYFLGKPSIGNLVIQMYTSSDALTLALQKGDINTTTGTIAMPSLSILLKTKTNKLQKYAGLSTYGVIMNTKTPALGNVDVRQAIQRAIDQKSLIQKGELNGVFPANAGWLSPVFDKQLNSSVYQDAAYGFNLSAAKALLKKAGYTFGSDGIAQKDGKKLTLSYYEPSGAPAQEKEASMIQGWLKQAGIKTTPHLITGPEMTQTASVGDYDLIQSGLASPPAADLSMSSVFSSRDTAPVGKSTPGLNYMRYQNPKLDKIMDKASATLDRTTQTQLLQQAQKIIADDAPIAVMYNVGGHIVYRNDQFTGYDTKYPVWTPFGLMHVHPAK